MLLYFSVLFSHILYALVWVDTSFVNNDIRQLICLATIAKMIQFVLLSGLIINYTPSMVLLGPKLSVGICGQILNTSVYYKLGKVGVYYGNLFGYNIPRCTTFPFDMINHPQYTGCIMSLISIALIYPYIEVITFCSFWSSLYIITSAIES